jgi:hypothetical protein
MFVHDTLFNYLYARKGAPGTKKMPRRRTRGGRIEKGKTAYRTVKNSAAGSPQMGQNEAGRASRMLPHVGQTKKVRAAARNRPATGLSIVFLGPCGFDRAGAEKDREKARMTRTTAFFRPEF